MNRSGKFRADKNKGLCQNVTENDMVEVLCSMKAGKAGGSIRVTSDLKLCRQENVKILKGGLLDGKEMPQTRRKTEILPLLKEKRDTKYCGSYRSVKLLEQEVKVIQKNFQK